MLALTRGAPKELLPVAGVPVVERVARECAASGITDLLVVTAPGKEAIEAHLRPLAGAQGMPGRIEFVVQPEARGLADAIRLGRDFADDGAIAVALPDNLFVADRPALRQVIDVADATGKSAVAVVGIAAEEASRRGATAIYQGTVQRQGEYRITHIPDKGAKSASFDTGGAAMAYTGVGRYAFGPRLWQAIDEVDSALPKDQELDDIPVMQLLMHGGLLTGCLVRGVFLVVGVPAGYHVANEGLALREREPMTAGGRPKHQRRVFLLSPARCDGVRARILLNPHATFPRAVRLREKEGAELGEVFSFLSGLYFRGKLTYARAFAHPPKGVAPALVITTDRGMMAPEARVTRDDLLAFAQVDIAGGDERYLTPLRRDAEALAEKITPRTLVVLLGSIATGKYVDTFLDIFGERLVFPVDFVGRGDMSRGGLLLRCAVDRTELAYIAVAGAVRKGTRPPKLEPRRYTK
jgi:UTP-glucose-1-phosphate uridylyltransferase